MRAVHVFLGASLLALAACETAPAPTPLGPGETPAAFAQQAQAGAPLWPAADWWKGFNNAELAGLIADAQAHNNDLAAAEARLRQADARARQAGAALLPTLGLNGDVTHAYGQSGGHAGQETDFDADLAASYELDFWGKNRDALQSAQALSEASRADRQTVALTVTAATANAYFTLLSLRERLVTARANLASSRDMLGLVQRRVKAGFAAPADAIQETANLAAQETALPALEQQELEARTALAMLLGRPPEGFDVKGISLDGIAAPAVAPGLPSELLRRRPDLVTAEANLAAAHADLAAAEAAYLPDITLTANAGLQSPALNAAVMTLGGTGFGASVAAGLVQTIFDGGKIAAKTDEMKAREEELLAQYRGVAFAAFGDVENALGNLAHEAAQDMAAQNQVTQSERLLMAAQNKYRAGSADFLVVVDAQRSLYAARDQLAQIRVARLSASVALFKALGGGWTEAQLPKN
jgi:NodT family efflux transporter outer membrane factor (OMF) lipoprotein